MDGLDSAPRAISSESMPKEEHHGHELMLKEMTWKRGQHTTNNGGRGEPLPVIRTKETMLVWSRRSPLAIKGILIVGKIDEYMAHLAGSFGLSNTVLKGWIGRRYIVNDSL